MSGSRSPGVRYGQILEMRFGPMPSTGPLMARRLSGIRGQQTHGDGLDDVMRQSLMAATTWWSSMTLNSCRFELRPGAPADGRGGCGTHTSIYATAMRRSPG